MGWGSEEGLLMGRARALGKDSKMSVVKEWWDRSKTGQRAIHSEGEE